MKKTLLTLVAAGLATAATAGTIQVKTSSDTAYAMGYQFGDMAHHFQIPVDVKAYNEGLKAGLSGAKPRLTKQQMQQQLLNFQTEMQIKGEKMMNAQSAANAKVGEKFLAENKVKKGVVTLPDGLQYKILEAGKGAKPKATDVVTVDYEGRLVTGKVFDSSYKRGQPASFPVNGVIPGWTQALQLMPVGSTWELYIPAKLAYGARGVPGIGPNQVLIFKVHLIKIK